ncbi:hypothetical protein LXL04_023782 [Taraxacum kok-saghyz]
MGRRRSVLDAFPASGKLGSKPPPPAATAATGHHGHGGIPFTSVLKLKLRTQSFQDSQRLKDNKTRWKNRPKNIPDKDFQQLLNLWNNKVVMKRCSLKKDARMSQKNMHTAGPKRFARIREEIINDDPVSLIKQSLNHNSICGM